MNDARQATATVRRRKLVVAGILSVVALNVLAWLAGWFAPDPGGPRSSSFATGPNGLAAYAELLARSGHRVTPLRAGLSKAQTPVETTVIVLDPDSVAKADISSLRSFVSSGGRLVAGGAPADWVTDLVAGLDWSPRPVGNAGVIAPTVETAGVEQVEGAGEGSFSASGGALPLLGANGRAIAAVGSVGKGEVVALADASPLQNAYLGRADNAAFGVALVGDSESVLFAEAVHGYGEATGLAALPERWKWALGLAVAAALVFMAARARRLGPPEQPGRPLPPPRVAYVDSLAGILARTDNPPRALEPLGAAARSAVGEPGRPEVLANAAHMMGLDNQEVAVLENGIKSEDDGIVAAAVLARFRNRSSGPP